MLDRPLSLMMTADSLPAARMAPEWCMNDPPKEGVGNAGYPLHPQPRAQSR
jgi:hypothetical protein